MTLLSVALFAEAKPFIEKLNMKRDMSFKHYQLFVSENYALLITGVGKMNACAAVTEALVYLKNITLAVNVGTAASAGYMTGSVFVINRLLDESSGRAYYPDMYNLDAPEEALTTVEKVVCGDRLVSYPGLVDMEGAGFAEAAKHFLTWDRIALVKCVSDNGADVQIKPQYISDLMNAAAEKICGLLEEFVSAANISDVNMAITEKRIEILSELLEGCAEKRHISTAMRYELDNLFSGVSLSTEAVYEKVVLSLRDYAAAENDNKYKERARYQQLIEQISELMWNDEIAVSALKTSGKKYSHIYVEKNVTDMPLVKELLRKKSEARVIEIEHFKDVFNRAHQSFAVQKRSQAMILAKKQDNLIYKGAPVCQSFGNEHFYYTSMIMNCPFDCDYCYLQGMYPCGHMTVFVNIEDYFAEVERLLAEHPVYLCVSYDTDMLAMESSFGFGKSWCEFSLKHNDLTVEIRTKSNAAAFFKAVSDMKIPDNVILAWTLSPDKIVQGFEKGTASLEARLQAMKEAGRLGFKIRACFDPAIWINDFEKVYGELIDRVFGEIAADDMYDVSIGTFRISRDYLKLMRANRPDSQIVHKPYVLEEGVAGYGCERRGEMMSFLRDRLLQYISEDRIFSWEDQ